MSQMDTARRQILGSSTMQALIEQHGYMVAAVNRLTPTERAVIADRLGAVGRDDWSDVKNRAVHELEQDFTYDQLSELLSHGKNVVQRGVVAWRRRNGVPDWPMIGKRQRRRERHQHEWQIGPDGTDYCIGCQQPVDNDQGPTTESDIQV